MAESENPGARCLRCGYGLRGLSETVCPECGRAFAWNDRSTFVRGGEFFKWRRWAQPPGVVSLLVATGMTLALLPGFSEPRLSNRAVWFELGASAVGWFIDWIGPAAIFVATLTFLFRVFTTVADRQRRANDRVPMHTRRAWRWGVLPVLLLLLTVTSLTRWPMQLRFALSRAELQAAADACLENGPPRSFPDALGLYYVNDIRATSTWVWFGRWPDPADEMAYRALYYSPSDENPMRPGETFAWRLAPGWYIVVQDRTAEKKYYEELFDANDMWG